MNNDQLWQIINELVDAEVRWSHAAVGDSANKQRDCEREVSKVVSKLRAVIGPRSRHVASPITGRCQADCGDETGFVLSVHGDNCVFLPDGGEKRTVPVASLKKVWSGLSVG